MNNLKLRLPEVVVPGKRLGRSVNHDLRSARYLVPESAPATTTWKRVTPILDQGNLGSCVGNAFTGVLGSDVYFDTVPKATTLDEPFAVKLYSLATQLDSYAGTYPPTDTGSDGLSGAKAVQKDQLASGYVHATSLAACYTLIKNGPFAVGFSWHAGMDTPTSEGVVHATGAVRGGHEFEILNYNASTGLWEAVNSWGDSWAKGGHFFIPDEDFTTLLAEQGDATQLTPVNQPAPTPTPVPTPPAPTPTPTDGVTLTFTADQAEAIDMWADNRWGRGAKGARDAWLAVRNG